MRALFVFITMISFSSLFAQTAMPDAEIKDLSGHTIKISDYLKEDKITVISFWATWCSPCKKELDNISEVYETWQEDYDVELLAISVDNARSQAKIRPMTDTKGWDYTILHDPNQVMMQALNFQSVPQTFLIDKNGQIVYEHTGYLPGDEFELEDHIVELHETGKIEKH